MVLLGLLLVPLRWQQRLAAVDFLLRQL